MCNCKKNKTASVGKSNIVKNRAPLNSKKSKRTTKTKIINKLISNEQLY